MTTEEKLAFLNEDKKPNFCIHVDFRPGTKNPQRLFQAAAKYITALQSLDKLLVSSIETDIQTVLLLEQLEIGSLKIWLRQFLNAVDDDALKNIDWKPAVGKYLVKGKYLFLKMLSEKKTLPELDAIKQVSNEIHNLAQESGVRRMPFYKPITAITLAEEAKNISEAMNDLEESEIVTFISDDGEAQIGSDFIVIQDDINKLLINNTIENNVEMILMVRKPDFLGETKWDFKFQKRNMSAAIEDQEWLENFQNGEIDIRPGDALHVIIHESVSYSADGEVVEEHKTIISVKGVIKQQSQFSLK